ncbi:MAG: hypothetical protein ACI4TX_01565 [Christensenellales bacterium]
MNKENKKRGCSSFLYVFLGIVIGFVLTVGTIVGVGYYAYSAVNLNTVEKAFGINLSDVPADLKDKTIKQIIPMVNEVSQLSVREFCTRYEITLPVKIDVGYDEGGNKLYIDLTEAVQPMLDAKVVDAFGKINEVIDYFTISNTFALLSQVNNLPDFHFLHDVNYKDKPIMEIVSLLDDFKISDLMETTADLDNGILKYVKDMKLVELSTESGLNDTINNIQIGEILNIDSSAGGIMGAISTLKVGELTDNNIINAIGTLTLEEVLSIDSSVTGVMAEVKNLTINQIKNGEIDDAIKNLTLNDVMDITETSGIIYELKDVKIGDLTSTYIMNNITVGTALGNDSTSGIMGVISVWKLSELTESNIMAINIGDALDIPADATGIMGAIKDLAIADLKDEASVQDAIKVLKISDFITISGESVVFDKIKDIQLQNLNDANIINSISTLKVKEILNDSGSSNKIWSIIKESEIGSISTTIDNLKLGDVIEYNYDSNGDGVNDSYDGFLSFLIDESVGKNPKITELSSAIDSAVDAYIDDYFATKTVEDLVNDGILTVDTSSAGYNAVKGKLAKTFIEEAINAYIGS